jgi:hypothetical protein
MNAISIGVRTCERECALHYALGQWTELNVFCSDGAVSIDNNVSEREMKRVVLNRKNSLFVVGVRLNAWMRFLQPKLQE